MNGVRGFFDGAGAFGRGWRFIREHPQHYPWLIIPSIVNTILYIAAVVLCVVLFKGWIDEFFQDKDAWYWTWTGAKYFAWLIYVVLLLFSVVFTFIPVGIALSAPFNEVLSQKVEATLLPHFEAEGGGVRGLVLDICLAVLHAVLRTTVYVFIFVATLPVRFIPFAGQIIMGYFDIRFLAWEGLDCCMGRRRMGFTDKVRFLARHRARTLGLGLVGYLLVLFPLTALFAIPMLTLSGTVLYCEIKREPAEVAEG